MGNCIERYRVNSPAETDMRPPHVVEEQEEARSENENGSKGKSGNNMRIKIVLSKEELGWLLQQLKSREGKRLEDVLGEIQRSREKSAAAAWKPSLDSITECPEVISCMDR